MDRIRLAASDMDCTLLDDEGRLPPGFEETVRALAQQGILFVAASGRPLYTLEGMFPTLREQMAFIGDNGGAIRWRGEMVYQSEMPAASYQAMARFTASQPSGAGVLCALDGAFVERQYERYDAALRKFYTKLTYVERLEEVTAPSDKYSVYFPQKDAARFYESYTRAFGGEYALTMGGLDWIDVMNVGISKGEAVGILGRLCGIAPEQMMAFGDTYNDAEMLRAVKYGFLMENGSPDLRGDAAFLAPPNREYGVMQILRRVLEKKGLAAPEDFVPSH